MHRLTRLTRSPAAAAASRASRSVGALLQPLRVRGGAVVGFAASHSLCTARRWAGGDAALADVTRRELDEELHRSGKPEEPAVPAGWTVKRSPQSCTFELHRQYEDEKIIVRYTPTENTDVNYHEISVFITRAGKTMQVDLSVEEGELVLDAIAYHADPKLALEESAEAEVRRSQLYPGPKVSELDDTMVDHFVKYLEKRGIHQELGEFVSLYSFWAEQQEFEVWLKNVNEFVS